MQMTDSQRIAASPSAVWAALNDPEVLKRCIPGCDSLEMTSPTEMTAKVTLKIGPVKATFGGKVTLSDFDPPHAYKITGEGSGGVAGFAKGGAVVRLDADGEDATILTYEAAAQIGGKIAQLGARLIDSTSKRLAADFFQSFAEVLAPAPAPIPAPEAEAEAKAEPSTADVTVTAAEDTAVISEETAAAEEPAKKGWFKGIFGGKAAGVSILALGAVGALAGHTCCLFPAASAGPMWQQGSICHSRPIASEGSMPSLKPGFS